MPNHSVIATDVTSLVPQEEVIYNPQEIKSYSLKPTNEISFSKPLQLKKKSHSNGAVSETFYLSPHVGMIYSNYQQLLEN